MPLRAETIQAQGWGQFLPWEGKMLSSSRFRSPPHNRQRSLPSKAGLQSPLSSTWVSRPREAAQEKVEENRTNTSPVSAGRTCPTAYPKQALATAVVLVDTGLIPSQGPMVLS